MKIASKILLTAALFFCSFSSPLFAMDVEKEPISRAVKGTKSRCGKFTCIFDERPPYPDSKNPYQVTSTKPSAAFLNNLQKQGYEFPTGEDKILQLGGYKVDLSMCLGSGTNG